MQKLSLVDSSELSVLSAAFSYYTNLNWLVRESTATSLSSVSTFNSLRETVHSS
jgi:hypothetical protein